MRDLIAEVPYIVALSTYLSWTILFLFGHVRDVLARLFWGGTHPQSKPPPGYAELRQDYEDFYTRRAYYRVSSCFQRPICSAPSRTMDVIIRTETPGMPSAQVPTGEIRTVINLGSYNYLGFASSDEYCTPRVQRCLERCAVSACASRDSGGTTSAHVALEAQVAEFLEKEACLILGMGYATNSAVIPALCGTGDLIISDALNHASIVSGARGSGARVKVFKHNDAGHLDRVLRQEVAAGQPRTHRPWRKIVIIIEGIYSMEGEICDLKNIVAVKNKYGAYLYLDEAHSIGALGTMGRGACEHCGVPFSDVEILMGTFTKSFGSCGGYIAADASVIQHLQAHCPAHLMSTAMSAPAIEQALAALDLIRNVDGSGRGTRKMQQLRANANYARWHLTDMGFNVLGDWDSPVMPVMLYLPGAILRFSRLCLQRHVAVVVVGFPATSLLTARARICISAAHTKADLDVALRELKAVGEITGCLYRKGQVQPPLEAVLEGTGAAGEALLCGKRA